LTHRDVLSGVELSRVSQGRAAVVLAAFLFGFAANASAQAFIPAAGEGTVSLSYQFVNTHGHRGNSGTWYPNAPQLSSFPEEQTDTHTLLWYLEYGLSDKIAVHASLPYMQVRYDGPFPHTIGFDGEPSNLDDGTYHGAFQDFYLGARFKLVASRGFAVTPFTEVIIPSHGYESLAQTAVGRDLRALVLGAAIGGFLEQWIPGLFFQTRASYAFVQHAVDISPSRLGIDSALGYFVTPRFAIQFVQTFQYTVDGIDFVGPPRLLAPHNGAALNDEYYRNHDRLTRANALNLGAGMAFDFSPALGVFATLTNLTWGQNIPPPRSVTVGLNWTFHTRRPAFGSSPSVNRLLARE
jgi:hypothetical protein